MIEKSGFTVTAMEMFYVEVANAEEFYEVYKGVVQEFSVSNQTFLVNPIFFFLPSLQFFFLYKSFKLN